MRLTSGSRRIRPAVAVLTGMLALVMGCARPAPDAEARLTTWLLRSSVRDSEVTAAVEQAVPSVQAALEDAFRHRSAGARLPAAGVDPSDAPEGHPRGKQYRL